MVTEKTLIRARSSFSRFLGDLNINEWGNNMNDLSGRISVVTGSAMGIGREIALRLARDGSDIVIVDIEKESAQEVLKEIQSVGRKSLFFEVDVTQWDQVKAMVDQVLENFNRVDILINNAGIVGPVAPVWEYQVEDWDRVMETNMKGTFLCCKAVIPSMLKRKRGRIVNIASISGKEGNPNMCAYSSSKAAVIAFTKALGKEVAHYNIIVNCIAPALIETRMLDMMGKEQRELLLSKIPMGRFGKPSEVSALVKFLVSDECNFSTGQCYDLSGGRAVY
jgi:NAD(P)-dependent dehydrogenase (short-subunit alcohol dehydrogenase family)